MPQTTTQAEIERLERTALAELTDLLSGAAVCRVPADRAVRAKHLEGRAAALADLRRALAEPDAQPAAVIDQVDARWSRGPGGPLWDAYRTGGRQVLAELADGAADR
ncbi:MAG: hypothetical protein L6367_05715 [Cellulomonas sp.]|nr:hypothetical protein [Actinomycetota bacterium]MCG2798022.1 hypothetical protein [Cellulomonas sp.]